MSSLGLGEPAWSSWQPLNTETVPSEAGIYQVRLIRANGQPAQLPRFLGTDTEGILCAGRSNDLERRLRQFVASREKGGKHSEGNLLRLVERHSRLREVFPDIRLELRYATVGEGGERWEEQILKHYLCRFGELPPLNSVIPRRDGGWDIG